MLETLIFQCSIAIAHKFDNFTNISKRLFELVYIWSLLLSLKFQANNYSFERIAILFKSMKRVQWSENLAVAKTPLFYGFLVHFLGLMPVFQPTQRFQQCVSCVFATARFRSTVPVSSI